jgi:DNA mismatch repair protein MutL
MPKIHRLPTDLANQIAAGEVVERPSSAVKELVENAIDAGARRITVEIDQAGLARLRVTDDGEGMDEADARLALERHATSKIASVEDLSSVRTFGFRGEALPSIASVSKLSLVTRRHDASEAIELLVDGGGPPRVRPSGAAPGTSVDVADLFFNVPARRKFLKALSTESASVGEVVLAAALARPEITFVLIRDGKIAREYLRVGVRAERVAQTLAGEHLEECHGTRGPMKIEAHLGPPERARAGAVGLHLFVNGRPVKDRQLARAVAQAYGSVLEPGRYPVGVVYIDVPPENVDVNVHPQKSEVRFADARALFDALTRELHGALSGAFVLPGLGTGSRRWINAIKETPSVEPTAPGLAERAGHEGTWRSFKAADIRTPPPPSFHLDSPASAPGSFEPETMKSLAEKLADAAVPRDLFGAGVGFYARLEFLAQLRSTYLLCEGDDGLYVLDQHAAAERVTFDRLRRAYASRGVATQGLLIPEVVELSADEVAALEGASDTVAKLGVELRAVGANAVAVHAVPRILLRAAPERIVRDLLAELGHAAKRPFGDAADLVLATMACHGSIRAGDAVSPDEARALLRALDEADFAGHCPHGRPVVTRMPFDELERRVGR